MSKVTKFMKNRKFIFAIGFILGGLILGGTTYVIATSIASSNITYTNNNQTTVEGALDDLYQKADLLNKIEYYQYWRDTAQYTSTSTPSTVYPSYTSVATSGTTSTLVRTLYSNGSPTIHGACLYYGTTNKIFCLDQGYWASIVGSTTQSTENGTSVKTTLQSAMASSLGVSTSDLSCGSISSQAYCDVGSARYNAYSNGSVNCSDGSRYCGVSYAGTAYCG